MSWRRISLLLIWKLGLALTIPGFSSKTAIVSPVFLSPPVNSTMVVSCRLESEKKESFRMLWNRRQIQHLHIFLSVIDRRLVSFIGSLQHSVQLRINVRTTNTGKRKKPGGNISETTEHIDPKIINLSKRDLGNNELQLLSKGLKFTPTPTANPQELEVDIQKFGRKLRLVEFQSCQRCVPESWV